MSGGTADSDGSVRSLLAQLTSKAIKKTEGVKTECNDIKGYQPSNVYPHLIMGSNRLEAYRKSMCGKDEICLEGAWGVTWRDIVFWLVMGVAILGVAVGIGLVIMYMPSSESVRPAAGGGRPRARA